MTTNRRRRRRPTKQQQQDAVQREINKLISYVADHIDETTAVRVVIQRGYGYELHEVSVPEIDDPAFIGIAPKGEVIAFGWDYLDVVNQAEQYLIEAEQFESPTIEGWQPTENRYQQRVVN